MNNLAMDRDAWVALSRLLDEALDLPPAERTRWLDALAPEWDPLKPRLRNLLAHASPAAAADFLGTVPKFEPHALEDTDELCDRTWRVGTDVGPYRLVRELGEGGMGTVWLAERTDGILKRPVALKLPRGVWPRVGLLERIAREREILASLNHANIAALYDAGLTADGQPYLALECVDGRRIDDYARHEQLDVRARLRLFLQVAQAVAHAHAKLVVHRDLKPSNILVTADEQVKLLDFGIAKLIERGQVGETELTELSGRPLTPEYASPEQVAGEPLTVASDVYALGVVLYELLTGGRPYRPRRVSRGALEDAIVEEDVARPSESATELAAQRALRGDLDTIVLKALKKKPEDRYATVNAFADDVERYLAGLPIAARPDGTWYRASKFVRRHALAVSAAALVLVAVLVGAGMALWQARVALVEKERAEEVKAFIAGIFRDADPYRGRGKPLSAVDLLKHAKNEIDRVSETRPELRIELLNLVGSSLISLGDTEGAEAAVRQAVQEARRALGANHVQTVHARLLMTDVRRFRGQTKEMRQELAELLPVVRRGAGERPEDLVRVLENQAHLAIDAGQYAEAESAAQEALDLAVENLGETHPRTVAASMLLAASHLYGESTPAEALAAAERASRWTTNAYRNRPKHPHVIDMRQIYGRAVVGAGEIHRGIEEIEQAVADAREVFGPSSLMVGFFLGNVARYQRVAGDIRGALENVNRSLAIHAKHAQRESYTYAGGLTARGVIQLAARRGAAALEDLSASADTLTRLFGPTHEETLIAQFNRALALAYVGRISEAERQLEPVIAAYRSTYRDAVYKPHRPRHSLGTVKRLGGRYREALDAQQAALRQIADGPMAAWDRMPLLVEIGLNRLELGLYAQAAASLEQALTLLTSQQRQRTPDRAEALVGLGRAWLAQGSPARALPLLEEADAFWRDFDDPDNRWAGEAALWLGRCYAALGRTSDARPVLSRASRILSNSPIPKDSDLVQLARHR